MNARIFEVGPRDGLQNEPRAVSLENKKTFIESLAEAGCADLEIGAFVRDDRVPQMKDSGKLLELANSRRLKLGKARAWVLVPNLHGLERALEAGAKNIAVFTAATDGFNRANVGMTVKESLAEFRPLISTARQEGLRVRGYVSTAFGCPFDGRVPPRQALSVVGKLLEFGAHEVSIGDTIGVAVPKGRGGVEEVFKPALNAWGVSKLAAHFHDTRGTALANALRALELGVRIFDSSAGGLGGCPFAPGATGNLATEDLVYMLENMGVKTGIDLQKLSESSLALARAMKRPISSRYLAAYASKNRQKRKK
jgi:hydroxymethylglutaryl-CoA lyase